MDPAIQILIYEKQEHVHTAEATGPVDLGRQKETEPAPYCDYVEAGRCRVVIARLEEQSVSRTHAELDPLPGDRVRVTTRSLKLPIRMHDGSEIGPGNAREFTLPLVLTLGTRTVRISRIEAGPEVLHNLEEATRPPGEHSMFAGQLPTLSLPPGAGRHLEGIVRWLQVALDVLQSAVSSSDFFAKAAQAVVELAGLDSGRVLLLEDGEWTTAAQHPGPGAGKEAGGKPSRRMLAKVYLEKRTCWQVPGLTALDAPSLAGVEVVVAAPILDSRGEVLGVLYGTRHPAKQAAAPLPFARVEAMFVELLAGGVAAGLARLEQERPALALQVRFEQFFTPELARHLAARPDLLEGRDCEVTALFCDIRGFSRISERLGPARTMTWMSEVLGVLSDCVLAHQGVLVNYIGDELQALWGAPEEQSDHAELACRAALAMLDQLPVLNGKWRGPLQEEMSLGIGINTGPACVGNIGSRRKFMYGAQGNTINLASRVQGATKYLRCRLLVTEATRAKLGEGFPSRRLCRVRVVNIGEPVDLHELVPAERATDLSLRAYEKALADFEAKNFRQAARTLGGLLTESPEDGPSVVLLSRVVQALIEDSTSFNGVWSLPGK